MTGMLKLRSVGLKLMMLLKDSKESQREAAVVKVVIVLKSCIPSLSAGRLSNCVKIVSLILPVIELLMQLYISLEIWMALLLSSVTRVASISVSIIEWYLVKIFLPSILMIPSSPVFPNFPSRTQTLSDTTHDGNEDTSPFHTVSVRLRHNCQI